MQRILWSLVLGWSLVTIAEGVHAAPATPVERFVHADRLNLRAGPTEAARVLAVLRIGTPVEVVDVQGGWTQIASRPASDGATIPLEGWVASAYLEPWPPEPVPLREAWQSWNARGEVGNTLALLERIVALDGTDPDEWAELRALAGHMDDDRARSLEAFAQGRRRVYVADGEGTLLFSFLPSVPGSVRDEAGLAFADDETGGRTLADLAATRRAVEGATWWALDDEGQVRTLEGSPFARARIVPGSDLADEDRRVIALGQPTASARFWVTAPLAARAPAGAAPDVTAASTSTAGERGGGPDRGGVRLLLQAVELDVGQYHDRACVTDEAGEVIGPCGGPYGYRVQIRRGDDVEDVRVATGISGC